MPAGHDMKIPPQAGLTSRRVPHMKIPPQADLTSRRVAPVGKPSFEDHEARPDMKDARHAGLPALRRLLFFGLVLLACSARSASESTDPPAGRVEQAILNGAQDTVDHFAVGVCHGSAGLCDEGTCSGALILPNVVATARHCVDEAPPVIDCQSPDGGAPVFGARKSGTYFITTNTTVDSPTTSGWYAVESIQTPADTHFCGNDIALLVLSFKVADTVAKPITPGVQYVMWDPAAHYAPSFTAIGYGMTTPAGTAGGASGTRRRLDKVPVSCVPGSENPLFPACAATKTPKEFGAGGGMCSGDSGSSAFETTSLTNNAPISFGVMSRGEVDCTDAAYTRFDAHRDFVLSVAKTASANWTLYPEPSWTALKPPPVHDAGAPPPTPKPLAIGANCTKESDCQSNVCADTGAGGKICSQACDPKAPVCPDGFTCRNQFCLHGSSVVAEDPNDRGCACTTARTRSSSPAIGLFGLAMAASAVRRLRRRARNRSA
jgi:MYXO-CTERM domain-containing protein